MSVRPGLLAIVGLAVAFGAFGCKDDEDVARESQSPPTAKDVEQKAGEAVDAAAAYVGEKKDQFLADAQDQLQKLQQQFDEMKEKTVAGGGEKLENLRAEVGEKLARATEELANLRQAGSDAWDKAAGEFSSAMKDLQETYREFLQAYQAQQKESDVARG